MVGGDAGQQISNAGNQAAVAANAAQAGNVNAAINAAGQVVGTGVGGTVGDGIVAGTQTLSNVTG